MALGLILLGAGSLAAMAEPCRVLVTAKQAGEAVYPEDVVAAPCGKQSPAAVLRSDPRRRIAVARTGLEAGTPLGRVYLPEPPVVGPGDPVQLTVAIGHVSISRAAVALQPARRGQRFFVRLPDGTVTAAPALALATGQEDK